MSHDRCYDHKCRACSKCAEVDESAVVWIPAGQVCAGHDDAEALRREVERLNDVIGREARARQHAESEVARLKSYIAAGVGGAS